MMFVQIVLIKICSKSDGLFAPCTHSALWLPSASLRAGLSSRFDRRNRHSRHVPDYGDFLTKWRMFRDGSSESSQISKSMPRRRSICRATARRQWRISSDHGAKWGAIFSVSQVADKLIQNHLSVFPISGIELTMLRITIPCPGTDKMSTEYPFPKACCCNWKNYSSSKSGTQPPWKATIREKQDAFTPPGK